jgi:hypothetical protein
VNLPTGEHGSSQVAQRLLKLISRITLDEFRWQDSRYSSDSRLGRELLYLIANDDWIRTTTEMLDVSRSYAVDARIAIDVDLDRISHEAFHEDTGQIWLPLFTTIGGGVHQENAALTVTDANGTELAPVPQADVRHQIAAALAEIMVNFAFARLPVTASPNLAARRPAAGRDQRLLLSAALFRLLSGETGEETVPSAPMRGTDRLSQAKIQLTWLLRPYVVELTDPTRQHAGRLAERAARIIEALTGVVVVVVGMDRRRSPAILNVTAPSRALELTSRQPWLVRWLALLRPRAHIRIDLLLPSADADRRIQVNLPDGVSIDTRRTQAPTQGLWIRSGPPADARHLSELVTQLRQEQDPQVRRCLADLAVAKADTLAETLRQHYVVPTRVLSGDDDALLSVTPDELADSTQQARSHLAKVRAALDAVADGASTDELAAVWGEGIPLRRSLLLGTATDSDEPRRLNGRVRHIESGSQRITPDYARINVPVYVPEGNSGPVARFAGIMSALLMTAVLALFITRLSHPSTPAPSAEAIASVLTLFAVILFTRLEIPDRSTLRGLLSFAGTSLVVMVLMPTVLLGILIAFNSTGWTPVVDSIVTLSAQVVFLFMLSWGPFAPGAGTNSRPARVLSTYAAGLGYAKAGVLRSEWWRSTTAGALVTGREAHAYVVWEHSGIRQRIREQVQTQPSLHKLLGTAAVRARAQGQIQSLTSRIGMERTGNRVTETGEVEETGEPPSEWPPNLLALLRSGTAREALTFLVFREPPEDWPPPGGVRVPIDPDRLAPIDEALEPLDIWVGVGREHEFAMVKDHAIVTVLDCATGGGLALVDIQMPAPPPVGADTGCLWARFRLGVHDTEMERLGSFLSALRLRLEEDAAARRLLVRTTPQGTIRGIPISDAVAAPSPGDTPVLAQDLDVVAIAVNNGQATATARDWRVLAICADAHDGIERRILASLARAEPHLRLAAVSHAVLHGTTVLLMLCRDPDGGAGASLPETFAADLPGAGVQVVVDEWQSSRDLGQNAPEPLLRVHAWSQDRPGMLMDVLNSLRPALRATLPGDPYGAVWHALLTVAAGRATNARFTIRLRVAEETVEHWGGAEYGEIERDARSRALQKATERQSDGIEYGDAENTVITVNLIRALRLVGLEQVAVHPGDHRQRDALGADRGADPGVGAAAEALGVHLLHHRGHPVVALGLALRHQPEVGDLRRGEQHRGRVRAGGGAGAAADAGGRVERRGGVLVRHRDRRRLGCRTGGRAHVPARLDDPVERGTVHDEVPEHRERPRAPRLDDDRVTVVEVPHVQLAGGGGLLRAVRGAVDDHRAHAADALAAVMVERDRVAPLADETLIEQVHHLEERHVRLDPVDVVVGEPASLARGMLPPDADRQLHL